MLERNAAMHYWLNNALTTLLEKQKSDAEKLIQLLENELNE